MILPGLPLCGQVAVVLNRFHFKIPLRVSYGILSGDEKIKSRPFAQMTSCHGTMLKITDVLRATHYFTIRSGSSHIKVPDLTYTDDLEGRVNIFDNIMYLQPPIQSLFNQQ